MSALLGDEHCEQLQVLKFEPGREPAQLRLFKRMDGFRILRHFKIVKLVVSISFIVFRNLLNRERPRVAVRDHGYCAKIAFHGANPTTYPRHLRWMFIFIVFSTFFNTIMQGALSRHVKSNCFLQTPLSLLDEWYFL